MNPQPCHPVRAEPTRFKRGNVVHALLARLPDIAPDARRDSAVKYAIAQGFPDDEAATLADETLRILNDPQFAPGFRGRKPRRSGVPGRSAGIGPGAQVNGRVDRLAVTKQEVLILDFKTNRPPPPARKM